MHNPYRPATVSVPAIAVTVLVASALGPAPAPAPTTLTLNRQAQVAYAYWHRTPPCGAVTVTVDPGLRERDHVMAEAFDDTCQISTMPISDQLLSCALITHEYGHLLGYGHSLDPTSIMFSGRKIQATRNCLRHWTTEWRCHGTRCFWARIWQPFSPAARS